MACLANNNQTRLRTDISAGLEGGLEGGHETVCVPGLREEAGQDPGAVLNWLCSRKGKKKIPVCHSVWGVRREVC